MRKARNAWRGAAAAGAAIVLALAAAAAALGQTALPPRETATEPEYIRVVTGEAGTAAALQTAIVRFRRTDPAAVDLEVDLVSAVHIGDAEYYEELNGRFRAYDAVLYELVAPAGTRVPLGGGGHSGVVSGTQLAMTRLLDLAFQLDSVDYTPANFVHADLSPEEVARSMADRGESMSQYLLKLFAVALSEQARDPYGVGDLSLLAALFSADRARLLKAQFAVAMLDIDTLSFVIEGENGSTLVGERNKRAVSVLAERIRLGDRRIAIFYGAAHMPDLAARLEAELGLTRAAVDWIDAWDLQEPR